MLISVGVYIWNTGRGSAVAAEERRVASIVQEQNTKFSQYIGNEIYGSEVENCIRRVIAYNNSNPRNQITVNVTRSGQTMPTSYIGDSNIANQLNSDGTKRDVINNVIVSDIIKQNIPNTVRNNLFTGTIDTNDENGMISSINFLEN